MIGIPLWRRKSIVRVIPRADMSEGGDIIMVPSSWLMLSKKEETSLTVEGGISASKISVSSGYST
jgi:hypothetical protein